MFRSRPLAAAGSLFASFALTGCGGSSPANIVTNPVPSTLAPVSISEPTPTLVPAKYSFTATISAPSPDFSGLRDTPLALVQGNTSSDTTPDQQTLSLPFSNQGQNIIFQLTLVKSGKIQAGDVLPLTPTSASTSEYTETFSARSAWKADGGSVRVDSIASDGLYTVSLLNVHYSPDTTSAAKGTFVFDAPGSLVFSVNFGVSSPGQIDSPVPSLR